MNLKSTLSAIGAGILGLAALVADMPSELQKQIAQPFPEAQRGYIGMVFAVLAYVAHHYSVASRTPAAALPVPPAVQPPKP